MSKLKKKILESTDLIVIHDNEDDKAHNFRAPLGDYDVMLSLIDRAYLLNSEMLSLLYYVGTCMKFVIIAEK